MSRMEIRKIPPKLRAHLCEIMSSEDQWKTLMASVRVSAEDPSNKYTQDHVNTVEQHSRQSGRAGMELLLDEWGTSGRVRPTVRDLHLLCLDLGFHRAADFIQQEMLEEVVGNRSAAAAATAPKVEDFQLGAVIATDELNKQLDSLALESGDPAVSLATDMSHIQSQLPHFAFSFLQTITNHFCETPHRQGGNKVGAGAFGSVYFGRLNGQLGLVDREVVVKRIRRDKVRVEEQFRCDNPILIDERENGLML